MTYRGSINPSNESDISKLAGFLQSDIQVLIDCNNISLLIENLQKNNIPVQSTTILKQSDTNTGRYLLSNDPKLI